VELPNDHDGQSFASLLRNVPFTPRDRAPLYWEFHEGGFSQAVLMDERWKAIRMRSTDAPIQVFDTKEDLAEARDIAAEKPDLVARAAGFFKTARADSPDWPIKKPAAKARE
jgi:hypothetical protein